MDVFARLIDELKNERGKGITNQMMADRCGVSQQHTNKLLNGKASLQKLNFGAVLNLFPRVRRLLEGDAQSISIQNSPSSAAAMYGMHSFKHTFVSFCTEAGVSPWVVSYLAWHTSPSMSEHYHHASEDAKRKAVLAIGAKKAGARERLLKMVEIATDEECEKMLAVLEKAGKGDCGSDKPSQDA